MKIFFLSIVILFLFRSEFVYANALQKESSPYLLQHAKNPVEWMPWSKKAFIKAKKEHKAIFVSIGYSTCHWCHVMEEESFSNPKIAALLNRYFISVKIDREELPQIDSFYQNIYKNHYGRSAGWPLNVFITPQKELFFISSYIPPKSRSSHQGFDSLLPKLHQIFNNKKELQKNIEQFKIKGKKNLSKNSKKLTLELLQHTIKQEYDSDSIGFGKSKKFPEASKMALMLDIAQLSRDKSLRKNYFDMLDVMALRGLYDHVNGGFFRYCVDKEWEIPHFEKMLYTQAELIPLYVKGYLLQEKELYKNVVSETIVMLSKHFEKDFLYWSASDADTQTKEGAFFTFTQDEIKKALRNNPYKEVIQDAMEFSYDGNFHERVHINFYTSNRPKGFYLFQQELQKLVTKRQYPFVDKKINTAWNAMMIEALYKVSVLDQKYLFKANEHLVALTNLMFDKGILYHQTIEGKKPKQEGLLEDYAFFIGALLSAYEIDFNKEHIDFASYLLDKAKEKFYKNSLWYLSEKENIPADLNDKYYISAQSKMLQNMIKLAAIKDSFEYDSLANKSIEKILYKQQYVNTPAFSRAYLMQEYGMIVIKSSKVKLQKNRLILQKIDYPYLLMKKIKSHDYLACSLRQCFIKEEDLMKFIKKLEMLHQ